ncbi:MAG: enoyl-CoA hydratase/isomerase family protein [Acidobacteriia bacterium]|nr:enoyl-CoA hydratase/isomerase family protein [Terriglobia bacterium]
MSGSELASLNTVGDLTRLTLRRAPLNFLSLELLQRIQELLESVGDSPPGRVLIIDSDCAAFSAGLDMGDQTREAVFLLLDQYHGIVRTLSTYPRPTIAIVRGVALGAGNELAACCDFVLASLQATFGQPEIKVGIMPSLAPLLLPHRIGMQRTLQMILTGNPVDAQEAERIGLIHRAVPEDALDTALEELLSSFRSSSIAVMEMALRAARGVRVRELESNLRDAESLYLNELMDLDDPIEGIKAFLEKRSPQWKHR